MPLSYYCYVSLEEDLVAKCKDGAFKFIGLPAELIPEQAEIRDGWCNICLDFCGLVLTRREVKMKN